MSGDALPGERRRFYEHFVAPWGEGKALFMSVFCGALPIKRKALFLRCIRTFFYGALMFLQTNIISTTFGRCIKIDLSDENTLLSRAKTRINERRRVEQIIPPQKKR